MINSTTVPTQSGSREQPEVSAYDVRVLAFVGDPARTLQGLCDGFGIDRATAQRVLAAGPAVLRRGVSAAEAQQCARLLGSLGAQVVIERAAQPPHLALRGRAGQDPGPQPLAAGDLEFDVLSALEAALDPGTPEPATRDLGRELELEASERAPSPTGFQGSQRGEFDLGSAELDLGSAELDLGGAELDLPVVASRRPRHDETDFASELPEPEVLESRRPVRDGLALEHADRDPVAATARRQHHDEFELEAAAAQQLDLALEPAARKREAQPEVKRAWADPSRLETGPKPVLRARTADVPRAGLSEQAASRAVPAGQRSRDVPLLQILIAIAVASVGHWLDSSVFYGNASMVSVIAHGLALQQLVLGARGLLR